MRSASPALITALAAGAPMWSADVYALALPNGNTFYWTGADQAVIYGAISYQPVSVGRSSWSSKNTTEVPTMTVQLYSDGTDYFPGSNLKSLVHNGLLDGAYLTLQRAFMPTFNDTSLGLVMLFGGMVGEVEINAIGVKITCTASPVQLEQNLPRRTYQASCMHTLYDAQCTLNAASFTDSYTVALANSVFIGWVGGGPADASLYMFGTMTVTSGAGYGQKLTVSNYNAGGVAFSYPLLTIPLAGDTFTVAQGCAKTVARCQSFGNILNYGGMPYIPVASTGL